MRNASSSLIVKITGIVFIAFSIVLGNEIRLGINRYIKNTLQTDAQATKVNLDKFSKAFVEKQALSDIDIESENFQKIYKDAVGGDSSKIKCLVDKQGHIYDISREGQNTPYLGLLLDSQKGNETWPVYFNLSSLKKEEITKLETVLQEHISDVNQVTLTLIGKDIDFTRIADVENTQIKELVFNNEVLIKNDLKGQTTSITGIVNSYENYNLEIYFYNKVPLENIKSSKNTLETKALVTDYQNMIKGLKMNITYRFHDFITQGTELPPTNYAEYFLLKPYEYEGKYYSTVVLRLIDYNYFTKHPEVADDMNDKELLEAATMGYVLVTQEYDNLTMNALRQFMLDNSSTYFLALILIIFICLVISYSIIMPIRRIETAAKHIARKEFDYPLDMSRHDELGDLSRSIHTMSQNLDKSINELYQEIERVQKLEQVRKEFVSNFTHEIKTPLGIINGFSELVELEQDEKKRNEYIKIIQGETKKINDLVYAMLDLSHLESQNISLSLEEVDLLDIVHESMDSMMYLFEKKNIRLITELQPAIIQADYFKIEMVIDNFISNALRYTEDGKTISIILNEHRFSIENEGAHIPEEELDKIWLTFHKVDKARNEQGTGLGLSICKAALDRHHFHYGVENTETGVLFYFEY